MSGSDLEARRLRPRSSPRGFVWDPRPPVPVPPGGGCWSRQASAGPAEPKRFAGRGCLRPQLPTPAASPTRSPPAEGAVELPAVTGSRTGLSRFARLPGAPGKVCRGWGRNRSRGRGCPPPAFPRRCQPPPPPSPLWVREARRALGSCWGGRCGRVDRPGQSLGLRRGRPGACSRQAAAPAQKRLQRVTTFPADSGLGAAAYN